MLQTNLMVPFGLKSLPLTVAKENSESCSFHVDATVGFLHLEGTSENSNGLYFFNHKKVFEEEYPMTCLHDLLKNQNTKTMLFLTN